MTGTINTTNSLLNTLKNKFIDNNNVVTASMEDLEGLFEEVDYYNSGTQGAEAIQKQIDTLQAAITALKTEAETLQKEIDEANLKISEKNKQLLDIVDQINKGTSEYQTAVRKAAKEASSTAINEYRANKSQSFEKCFSDTFFDVLKTSLDMNQIKALYVEYDKVKNSISPVAGKIQGYIDRVDGLQGKLDTTNATVNLLTSTKNKLSTTMEGAYKNVDTDSKIPIFSGKKEAVANEILNMQGANASKSTGISSVLKEQKQKWKAQIPKATLKKNEYDAKSGSKNAQLANLGEAINKGMLTQLQQSGMSKNEIMNFIATNWESVSISKNKETGEWVIPKGHDEKGQEIYNKINKFCTSNEKVNLTADSVNEKNVAALKKATSGSGDNNIITKMYKAGFTFKEAMYVLTQAFPDSGIGYNLDKQSDGRNYTIVEDSKSSGNTYKNIGDLIQKYWFTEGDAKTSDDAGKNIADEERSDPITFQQGDTTYTFINDRNGDGKFSYTNDKNNDLLGSQNGIDELKAYDTDGNGKIEGKELDQVILMSNKQVESVGENGSKDVDEYKKGGNYKGKGAYTNSVDFNIAYQTASSLGITSIDLSTISDKDKDQKSANGSELLNTFNITTNGKKLDTNIQAKETDNTKTNLETFYKQVADSSKTKSNRIYSHLSKDEFAQAVNPENYSSDDAKAAAELLKNMKKELEDDLKDAIEAQQYFDQFDLNIDWEEFQNLYDKDGTYLKTVIERGSEAAEADMYTENNLVNYNAQNDTGIAIDNYNSEIEVRQKGLTQAKKDAELKDKKE